MSNYLPEALVMEILLLLPTTTLVRFTTVCKVWNAMIKSHTFISLHFQRPLSHPSSPNLLIQNNNAQYSLYSYEVDGFHKIGKFEHTFLVRLPNLFFVGTINGLVCLSDHCFNYKNDIILWNPLIKRHVQLPVPHFTFETLCGVYISTLGFGFDSKKNDFKVVRICYVSFKAPPKVELYSLNEGSWKVIDASYVELNAVYSGSQCVLHGNVHWLAYKDMPSDLFQQNYILMFDVVEEKFNTIDYPKGLGTTSNLDIFVIEYCLSLLEYVFDGTTIACNIWMKGETWSKTFHINFEETINELSTMDGQIFRFGVEKIWGLGTSGEVLVLPISYHRPDDGIVSSYIYSFDLKTKKIIKVLRERIKPTWFHASNFTPSLALFDTKSNEVSCTLRKGKTKNFITNAWHHALLYLFGRK
ncbi:F-box protein At4g22390-like [Abrus precatorius]|uniref:F-box protein At4g22390-like n=1 Tax=Abrus precatorius TaxID=3816 RepID=A0A8B8MHF0_ABRPR|nr:F-box protein At4g22390-like [Abrus precatorius]